MTPTEYLADIKAELVTSDLVASFEVVEEWAQPDRGYIRIRMWLVNGDFLEVAEYFQLKSGGKKREATNRERYKSTNYYITSRWYAPDPSHRNA